MKGEKTGGLVSELKAMPPTVWVLFLGTFLNRFGTFVLPFLVLYLRQAGYSVSQSGVALAGYGCGTFAASLIGGVLADRIGRRNTIALSMFTSAASMVALSQASSFPLAVLFATFAGLTSELYRPASSALIADVVPPEHRVTGYAVYRLAINAGVAAGPAVAGLLAERSFLYVFIGDAITSVLFGIVALIALPHGIRSTHEESGWREAIHTAWRDTTFLLFILGATFVALIDFQIGSTFALHVRDSGFSNATYGALISLNGLIIILVELPLTNVLKLFRRAHAIAAGYLLQGLSIAMTAVAGTKFALAMVIVVFTIGEMIASPLAAAFVADAAPAHLRGRYMGLYGFTFALGMTVGPAAATWMYASSPLTVWILCAISGVAASLLVLAAATRTPREAVQAK